MRSSRPGNAGAEAREERKTVLQIVQTALELGFQYALVAMALFLSYRILDIADLTTDGSFVLGAAVSVTLILAAALLTGLGVFDKIAKRAGAGTLVPITGFANAVVSPAIDFKSEGFVTGMAAKMFLVAGPVIVFGTLASVIYGVILILFRLA